MTRSTGYFFALSACVFLGWLTQEFWFVGLEDSAHFAQRDLLRNEQRLDELRRLKDQQALTKDFKSTDKASGILEMTEDLDLISERMASKDQILKDDFENILRIASQKLSDGTRQDAFFYLYDLRSQVAYQYESDYLALIHEFASDIESKLEESGQVRELVEIFRQLVSLEPDFTPYYLSLAQWLMLAQEWVRAEETLALAKFDVEYSEEIELLESTIQDLRERAKAHIVPLRQVGKHYLVEMLVDATHSLSLMLDTGASVTVVKSQFVEDYFPGLLDEAQELFMKTANGSVKGSKVNVPVIALDSLSLRNVPLGLLPLTELSYDGLLGMDILGRFDFKIDQEKKLLILNPK